VWSFWGPQQIEEGVTDLLKKTSEKEIGRGRPGVLETSRRRTTWVGETGDDEKRHWLERGGRRIRTKKANRSKSTESRGNKAVTLSTTR